MMHIFSVAGAGDDAERGVCCIKAAGEGESSAAFMEKVRFQACLRLKSFSMSAFSSVTAQGLPWGQKSGSSVRSHCRTS